MKPAVQDFVKIAFALIKAARPAVERYGIDPKKARDMTRNFALGSSDGKADSPLWEGDARRVTADDVHAGAARGAAFAGPPKTAPAKPPAAPKSRQVADSLSREFIDLIQ